MTSFLFGLWHLGLGTANAGGDFLTGAAISVVSQGVSGLAFGVIFMRTRNLLAPSLFHIAGNSLG